MTVKKQHRNDGETAVKVKLAQWRWRLVVAALGVVGVRIAAGIVLAGDGGVGLAVVTVMDAVGLALVGVIVAAFVLYGRIYRARVPTE